ncbi:hypothetical protein Q0P05_14450, partial [Staphylococcus aureus]|nr:hypothetical protein [Staphylococcus aureus]
DGIASLRPAQEPGVLAQMASVLPVHSTEMAPNAQYGNAVYPTRVLLPVSTIILFCHIRKIT